MAKLSPTLTFKNIHILRDAAGTGIDLANSSKSFLLKEKLNLKSQKDMKTRTVLFMKLHM